MTWPVKILTGFLALIAVALVVGICLVSSRSVSPPPLPNPNGYDTVIRAARMLKGNTDYLTAGEEELRIGLEKNKEALNEGKKGLNQESRVRLEYSAVSSTHIDELPHLKSLAQVFAAQGRLAEMEHHPREAAQAYLDVIHLGHQVRGGTLLDSLVGVAIEAIGSTALEKLYPQLNAEECRETATVLKALEHDRETSEAVLAQEKAWVSRTFGMKGRITRLLTFRQRKAAEQRWAAKKKAQEIRTKQLLEKLDSTGNSLEKGGAQAL